MAQVFKGVGVETARMASKSVAFDSEADKVLSKVRSNAAAISDTGDFLKSIAVDVEIGKKGVLDRVVYSDDKGALAIEYGRKTSQGFAPGHHVFGKVLRG